MAIKFEAVVQAIEQIAPKYLQESWDNSGIQISTGKLEIEKILTTLELTDEIVEEAIREDIDLIVSHHPLIFGGIKSIDFHDPIGSMIVKLINAGICVYSSHTPFDKIEGGNNDYLAELIGLRDISGFTAGDEVEMIGRIGILPHPMMLSSVVDLLAEVLNMETFEIRFVGDPNQMITTVGMCTGAGADLMDLAISNGCQLFITGDLKYHDAQNAKAKGIAVIDAGHYGTEKTFSDNFADKLKAVIGEQAEVIESKVDIDPFVIL
jgi:dinuclear metal center YbgI/SA1388 family protein